MLNKKNIFILSIVFLLSLFVFLTSSIVDARAGGGHRFSGGGGSRSFSSSRSSSRSYSSSRSHSGFSRNRSYSSGSSAINIDMSPQELIFFLISHLIFTFFVTMLCTNKYDDFSKKVSTFIGIFIVTAPFMMCSCCLTPFVIFFCFAPKKTKNDYNANYSFNEVSNFSSITANDPSFNKDVFLERAKKAFIIVQEGWSNRDLSKAGAFLADGTYEQFQIQINTMKADHEIDLMKDINIQTARIVRLSSKAGYDSLSVQFTVRAVNYRLDDRNKSIKNGSTFPEEFTEIWTFMRRKGTRTIKHDGLIEGYCPNCGAKIEGGRISKCSCCSSLLRSGQHDWILAGITQASEWRNSHIDNPIAYKAMLSVDKSLNISHLEDKLTVIFWRLVESNRLRSVEPIHKVSTDDFAQAYSSSKYTVAFPKCRECGLGSQEVIGFITNREDYDYLIGQLVWSGISVYNNSEVFNKTMVVLRRKKGVTSDLEKCFCSSHCPNCGANEPSDLSSNTCEYCCAPFNDDSKDWMLSDLIVDFNNTKAEEYMNDARKSAEGYKANAESHYEQNNISKDDGINYNAFDYYSGNDLLCITVAMMLADGVIDNKEMNIIKNISKARNVSDNELVQIISRLQKTSDPVNYVLDTTAIRLDENLIRLLVKIAAADGRIDNTEIDMLKKVAAKMGLSENRLRDMINEAYEKSWAK